MRVISVRQAPGYQQQAIAYLQQSWPDVWPELYADSVAHCIGARLPLPQWYLLEQDGGIIGCAGLITNDFISRVDLYPWLCALFIEPAQRGRGYAQALIEQAKEDTRRMGFSHLYLSTAHRNYYERHGFRHIGQGYHPWRETSLIYEAVL